MRKPVDKFAALSTVSTGKKVIQRVSTAINILYGELSTNAILFIIFMEFFYMFFLTS